MKSEPEGKGHWNEAELLIEEYPVKVAILGKEEGVSRSFLLPLLNVSAE